jgi:DNA polymerase I-like protein with 3'-5' exonuclease and polymerase domains
VQEKMEKVWALSVPLKVDLGWGENWMAAHP